MESLIGHNGCVNLMNGEKEGRLENCFEEALRDLKKNCEKGKPALDNQLVWIGLLLSDGYKSWVTQRKEMVSVSCK